MDQDSLTRFRRAYWQALQELDNVRLTRWEGTKLTLPQLRILLQIRRSPGITIGQLARQLTVTVSTVSGLVSKLVERGLVIRTASVDDRRQLPLQLTEEGRGMAGDLITDVMPFLEQMAAEFGSDLDEVSGCLERVADAARRVREAGRLEEGA